MNEKINDLIDDLKTNFVATKKRIAASFDTTGSMRPAINQVKTRLKDLFTEMKKDLPGLEIALIAHGDYCDGDKCMTVLDFTDDLNQIMDFISNAPNTGGGDAPECYEFALNTAKGLSWGEEGGSLLLIGDDLPHLENPNNIDWKNEVKDLSEKNVKVFPMQCLYSTGRPAVNQFWEEVSGLSETPLLILEDFNDSANALEAVAYASAGVESYDFYKAKFASEVSLGVRGMASSNLAVNQTKLDSYVSTTSSTSSVPTKKE